jgi:hypothetical protein
LATASKTPLTAASVISFLYRLALALGECGTVDGAVWITHLKAGGEKHLCDIAVISNQGKASENCEAELCDVADIKLPAVQALGVVAQRFPKSPISIGGPVSVSRMVYLCRAGGSRCHRFVVTCRFGRRKEMPARSIKR